MAVTVQSPFKHAARISRARWHAVLDASGTHRSPLWNGIPAEDRRDVADALYDRIVAAGHDPAVWLAIAVCEHSLGTNPDSVLNRNDTRSWTNARTVRDPSLSGWKAIRDDVRRSQYIQYQTVVDSVQDGLYRVDEPGYAYRKANAVSIIDHTMIWTEGDGPQYAAKMVKLINEWMEEETPMAGDDDRFTWMPDVSEFGYPQGARGRAGYSIDLGIIHYTQGTASSGWLRGNNGSSTHYLTDPLMRPFEQHVREADAAWTAGNREYNLRGINVEGELPGDQWTPDLIRELAKTTLPIWKRNNIPLVYLGKDNGTGKRGLIGHADVPDQDHTDPGKTFDWSLYIAELRRLDGQQPPAGDWPKVPTTERDPQRERNPYGKAFWVPKVFVADIKQHAWHLTGYCLSEAFAETGDDGVIRVVQYFERARLELWQDGRVTRGLCGREALYARYPERAE